jgi:pectate lyase
MKQKKVFKKSVLCFFLMLIFFASAENYFSISDTPIGWASYTGKKDLEGNEVSPPSFVGGNSPKGKTYTVSDRKALLSALSDSSPKIVYIQGIIDMSDGMLPSVYNQSTTKLDNLISTITDNSVHTAKNYEDWRRVYGENVVSTEDQSGTIAAVQKKLSTAWKNQIILRLTSNTTIIGVDSRSGIRGGSISIQNVSNVVIRNLLIQDAYDPFPAIEANDGLNAEWDGIVINNSKYVWIDHCTIEDTFSLFNYITTKDNKKIKWQTYDGLLDIKCASDFITVSWCHFKNHDKTMLIGHSGSYTKDRNHQTISLMYNFFENCKQRLPMVRFATIHILNNYYKNVGSYAIGRREESNIYSENNYFENQSTSVTNSQGTMFDSGSYNIKGSFTNKSWNPTDFYSYTSLSVEEVSSLVPLNAGIFK